QIFVFEPERFELSGTQCNTWGIFQCNPPAIIDISGSNRRSPLDAVLFFGKARPVKRIGDQLAQQNPTPFSWKMRVTVGITWCQFILSEVLTDSVIHRLFSPTRRQEAGAGSGEDGL